MSCFQPDTRAAVRTMTTDSTVEPQILRDPDIVLAHAWKKNTGQYSGGAPIYSVVIMSAKRISIMGLTKTLCPRHTVCLIVKTQPMLRLLASS